jgi:farnesyl-diphosphate farnesyltransferase
MDAIEFSKPAALPAPPVPGGHAHGDSDEVLQAHLLEGVSRTFALTIPQLPDHLADVVSNTYLLCRIVDTIEDEPALSFRQKRGFCRRFVDVVSGEARAQHLSRELAPLLSERTLPAEHELIRCLPRVIRITAGLSPFQREQLRHCVEVMAEGMIRFQRPHPRRGLDDLAHMDRYCYHVAGIVGETLTELFCDHSPEIARHRQTMLGLAVSFGQGLQMTNILKDVWDDLGRGACWLPRSVFEQAGYDLDRLAAGDRDQAFGAGIRYLVGVALGHLRDALSYTLLIPPSEIGIRNFCLWAIGMAVLTLRKINGHLDYSSAGEVKISRRSVKATIIASRITAGHDAWLKTLFYLSRFGLPPAPPGHP